MIHAKNIDLTPSIQAFIEEKMAMISKFLNKDDRLSETRVEVGKLSKHHKKGLVYYAEINLKIGSKLLRGVNENIDLHTAIDSVRDEIERQIKKFKSKIRDTQRRVKKS